MALEFEWDPQKSEAGEDADLEMRDEYDFSGGVRGKYAERYADGTNLVELDPDVRKLFPDSDGRATWSWAARDSLLNRYAYCFLRR